MYYAYRSKDGRYYCAMTLNIYEAGDNLLFDTKEDCINYWRRQGIKVEDYEGR